MVSEAFMHVRTALGAIDNGSVTNVNTTGGDTRTSIGPNEVQKMIDRMIVDNFSRELEFRSQVRRERMDQLSFIWNIRADAGTSKAAWYSDGGAGTPDESLKNQCYARAYACRADYEVSGLLVAASSSYLDVLDDEAKDALFSLDELEEKQFVNGADAGAGGSTSGYSGLLQLMLDYTNHGDTSTIYGLVRGTSAGITVQHVCAGTAGTATGALSLSHLDKAITIVEKNGGPSARRIFLCSYERADDINALLQPQQRFQGSVEVAGGFRVVTYRGFPIIRSRRMSTNGVTNTGSVDKSTDADNAMYLLDMDNIVFKNVGGVDHAHVPITGAGDATNYLQRADVVGGYFKTYGTLVMKRFVSQCIIWNLTAPA